MPPFPNWCSLLGVVSLHTVLTTAGRQDQLLATEPGRRWPALGHLSDMDKSPQRGTRDRSLHWQPMQRGPLGHGGPSGPTTWYPQPSTRRTGRPRHFTAQRGHDRSAPCLVSGAAVSNTKISKDKWEMGTGFSRHQQPSAKTPEREGSATSLSSLPWAAVMQPQCSPSAHLEFTDPHFQLFSENNFTIPYIAFGLTLGFFLPFVSRSLQSIL